ncbi:DUF6933 domain-containing protein [Psychroserpens sp. S379A]|uniref:DUF6933 domain-containing protein n=1 Tax=Psychroserpens sp. S379A TaxID=3415137 RepID=UPI003C7BE750
MINIHCFKAFQNYYKIEPLPEKEIESKYLWTAQRFKADNCSCVTFIHHQTYFYVTLFDLKREDLNELQKLFVKELINHLEKYIVLEKDDIGVIKNYCYKLSFYEKSNDNKVNTMLSNIVTVIKGLNFWDFQNENQVSVKEEYDEFELFFDKKVCEKFLNSIR